MSQEKMSEPGKTNPNEVNKEFIDEMTKKLVEVNIEESRQGDSGWKEKVKKGETQRTELDLEKVLKKGKDEEEERAKKRWL